MLSKNQTIRQSFAIAFSLILAAGFNSVVLSQEISTDVHTQQQSGQQLQESNNLGFWCFKYLCG